MTAVRSEFLYALLAIITLLREGSAEYNSCAAIKAAQPNARDGRNYIWPKGATKWMEVWCDMTTDGGGWTVFQRRGDYRVQENFFRGWDDYKKGFGDIWESFWLGLENINLITEDEPQTLRIDMEDFEGKRRFAKYTDFYIGREADRYRLKIKQYSGDAGDSLAAHNNFEFSTKDVGKTYCANQYIGAWWYRNCHYSNLNGPYRHGQHPEKGKGVNWYTFHGWYYSLKTTEMKTRPANYRAYIRYYRQNQ